MSTSSYAAEVTTELITGDFTLMFWIKDYVEGDGATHGSYGRLFNIGATDIDIFSSSSSGKFRLTIDGTPSPILTVDMTDGDWHLVTLVYDSDSTTMSFYVDSLLIDDTLSIAIADMTTTAFQIGDTVSTKIFDVRFYSDQKTAKTIAYYYNNILDDNGDAVLPYV